MKKIIGIGNTLVDILLKIKSDDELGKFKLKKGGMELVDHSRMKDILDFYHQSKFIRSAGGSAANTIHALGVLNNGVSFIGKSGSDEFGDFFAEDLKNHNVATHISAGKQPTGKSLVLISQDSERTFATFLGASIELSTEDLKEEYFKNTDLLYIEGYLLLNQPLINQAVEYAKQKKMKIAIDLASFNVVEQNLDFLTPLIKNHIDIVFANEDEAKAFCGHSEPLKNLEKLANFCQTAIVKVGKDGALIKQDGIIHKIPPLPANRLDTTGAGDLFAAGFLYGWSRGMKIDDCGKIGTILASRVIEVIGAKMSEETWTGIKDNIDQLGK